VDLNNTVASSGRSSSRSSSSAATAATDASERAANTRRLGQQISETFASLGSSVQSMASSAVDMGSFGQGGGEAFVNYRTAIFNAYYQAWKTPEGITRAVAVADVRIVVARNGDILSSEFVSKSGDTSVDRSIQRALDQVERQKLPAFPPGATDTQRTFTIRFNLEAKQSAG
jgi:hypothetical protein